MPIQCPYCGQFHPDETWVCPETQRPLMQVCDNCGEWSWVTEEACHNCGTPLQGIPAEGQPTTQMAPVYTLPPASRSTWWWACGGLFAVGVVTVLCVAVLGFLQYRYDLLGKVNEAWARNTPTEKLFATPKPSRTPTRPAQGDETGDETREGGTGNDAQGEDTTQDEGSPTPTSFFPSTTPTLPPSLTPTLADSPTPTRTATPTEVPAMMKSIAFVSDRAGSNDIYIMDTSGNSLTQLTTTDADDRVPSWSPDGDLIAFQSNSDGDYELYVINVNTRSIRQLTSNKCNDFMPMFSPDGTKLAFYSDCDGNREIYLLNADGSNRTQLTITADDTYNWFPTWSPDGSKITFSTNRNAKYEVWVMNADGTNPKAITTGCVPVFSPDGQMIAFTEFCLDVGDMYLIRTDGTQRRVISGVYDCRNPWFSPDGTKIIFQSNRSGNDDIWMMDVNGANWVQLTDDPGYDGAPVWQP